MKKIGTSVFRNAVRGSWGATAAFGIAGALLANDAGAVTQNIIAGSACHDGFIPAICPSVGAMTYNPNDSVCHVTCPITRRNISNTNGLSAFYVTGDALSCTVAANTFNGGFVDAETKAVNGNVIFTNLNVSANTGTYSLECSITPGGAIYRVRWDEF